MADGNNSEVELPPSVKSMLEEICAVHCLSLPDASVRRQLSSVGEVPAMDILKVIRRSGIQKSLNGFIIHLCKKYRRGEPLTPTPPPTRSLLTSASPQDKESSHSPLPRCHLSTHLPTSENESPPVNRRLFSDGESSHYPLPICQFSTPLSTSENESPQPVKRQRVSGPDVISQTACRQKVGRQLLLTDYGFGKRPTDQISSLQTTLSKLEFRRFFLLLSYIGRRKLEDIVTPEDANDLVSRSNHQPMGLFESHIWDKYGKHSCDKSEHQSDRRVYSDWNSGKTHLYHCHVYQDGSYSFKGPYLDTTKTHLQRAIGDDNVLIVKFVEDIKFSINHIAEQGIYVGQHHYRFFVFKEERKEKKKTNPVEQKKSPCPSTKCYFVRMGISTSCYEKNSYVFSGKTISEARCHFMHVHMVSSIAKYMARFSLILSKTIKLQVDLASVTIERIEDIPCRDDNGRVMCDKDGEPLIHTDGTGYISEDLAMKCPKDFSTGRYIRDENFEEICNAVEVDNVSMEGSRKDTIRKEPPLLMQCRLFYKGSAVKGTFLVNRKLKPGTIQIRPSMLKVETDAACPITQTFDSLEVVAISNRPRRTFLSKHLIALLSYGGVPENFFMDLLMNALQERRALYTTNKCAALRVAINHIKLDHGLIAARMISSGVPLNEPYLQHCLSVLAGQEKTKLESGKLPISDTFYLMGTADPTGVLNNNQVCVILGDGQISGKVLVYRNPGLHFGDIHVMTAVYVEAMEDFVGNAKYGIFFSTKGRSSAAFEMASGDFDGDMYWVSRNPQLLQNFRQSDPWSDQFSAPDAVRKKPDEFSPQQLEYELLRLFSRTANPSLSMGATAESWMVFMDRFLSLGDDNASEKNSLKEKMHRLIDIYYEALDAPKSGKMVVVPENLLAEQYPHYMEKGPERSYHSTSILGHIYDEAVSFQRQEPSTEDKWSVDCFDADSTDVPLDLIMLWGKRYQEYRKEMKEAMNCDDESKNAAANAIIMKYKLLLYDAAEFEESTKNKEEIYKEAHAIFCVNFNYARKRNDAGKCSFAWKVAGSALCSLYVMKQNEMSVPILPSVLKSLVR